MGVDPGGPAIRDNGRQPPVQLAAYLDRPARPNPALARAIQRGLEPEDEGLPEFGWTQFALYHGRLVKSLAHLV